MKNPKFRLFKRPIGFLNREMYSWTIYLGGYDIHSQFSFSTIEEAKVNMLKTFHTIYPEDKTVTKLAIILAACLRLASGESDWDKFQQSVETKYKAKEAEMDRALDFKQYLDDKLITFKKPKNVAETKEIVKWLALYELKGLTLPDQAIKLFEKNESKFEGVDPEKVTWELIEQKLKE